MKYCKKDMREIFCPSGDVFGFINSVYISVCFIPVGTVHEM